MSRWHKDSRFWRFAPYVVLLACALAIYFDDPRVFTDVTMVVMGGAGAKSTVDQYNQGRPATPESK